MSRPGCAPGSLLAPWPEEMNRRVATLRRDSISRRPSARATTCSPKGWTRRHIHVTGNTVIDALLDDRREASTTSPERCAPSSTRRFSFLDPRSRMILVTGHRRENFGERLREHLPRAAR